jgi:hypothetical protein
MHRALAGPLQQLVEGGEKAADEIARDRIAGLIFVVDIAMFDVLDIGIEEPVPVAAIRIETTDSPSWVAWREIEIVVDG